MKAIILSEMASLGRVPTKKVNHAVVTHEHEACVPEVVVPRRR